VRAHGGEVTDIAIQSNPDVCLVATSGRDRMVQLFKKEDDSLQLIQTLDDHVGAVGSLLFMDDGEKLLSCSADRTVIIRERLTRDIDGNTTIAFFLSKFITLKASPISMTLAPDDPDTLVVSTIDRNIQRFNVSSGRHIHSFRASDPETNDTVVMSSLIISGEVPGRNPRLLLGVSTTDKSIRVYDFEKDVLLTREFGHTEGVSDVVLLETKSPDSAAGVQRTLISTGLDGVVMIWDLSISQQQLQETSLTPARAEDATPAKELTAAKPPLRHILSRSEIAGLRGQETPTASPTPIREQSPPRLRKRTSRFGLGPLLSRSNGSVNGNGNAPSPTTQIPSSRRSPTINPPPETKGTRDRSPSPQSPKPARTITTSASISNFHRPIDTRSRTKSNGASNGNSEFGSLNMSTEQVCRTLRAYRKKLNGSTDRLNAASELERELDLTVRALGDRSKRMQANGASQVNGNNGSMKDIIEKRPPIPPMPTKQTKVKPRRIPSTPNLGQRVPSSRVPRPRSLDADGEG
jgi:WD40 repeat protein